MNRADEPLSCWAAVPYSRRALLNDVRRLRSAWRGLRRSRDRDGVYAFLTSVYDLVALWTIDGKQRGRARRALQASGVSIDATIEPFSALITVAAHPRSIDGRTISKWSRVLRYAQSRKLGNKSLKDFIKGKGGINACASRYSQSAGGGD